MTFIVQVVEQACCESIKSMMQVLGQKPVVQLISNLASGLVILDANQMHQTWLFSIISFTSPSVPLETPLDLR